MFAIQSNGMLTSYGLGSGYFLSFENAITFQIELNGTWVSVALKLHFVQTFRRSTQLIFVQYSDNWNSIHKHIDVRLKRLLAGKDSRAFNDIQIESVYILLGFGAILPKAKFNTVLVLHYECDSRVAQR